ncbi:glycerophosphodiester phosphodiesterase [Gracilibacillus kekensis]|uniref:Glycerophosphoryl diester phosphodiesterase n=1 Tax=Gracilibacillus kekensis TaxID=1027249 RepID=A0A1M7JN73_9BACI|nr:glycerophosphodiester phosphodiesterase family protein [Gracilibacillus kekensis]SHM54458.1 glycerophosphoryl diester phosphodiesterase [Gracilibacillus kekensis]
MSLLSVLKSSFILVLISTSLVITFGFVTKPVKTVPLHEDTILVAHRGASYHAPENTLGAFQRGIELNADYLECDVQLTKDGHVVIMHDKRIDRTTNFYGMVKDLTLEELKKVDAGLMFSTDYIGEEILTLEELLIALNPGAGIMIEIKYPDLYPDIEEKVVNIIKDYQDKHKIIVQSFDFDVIKKVKKLLPDVETGVIVSKRKLNTTEIADLANYVNVINYNVNYLSKDIVEAAHNNDIMVTAWSIKKQKHFNKAMELGVDGIVTNFPDWIIK